MRIIEIFFFLILSICLCSVNLFGQEVEESHKVDSICLRDQVVLEAEALDKNAIPPHGFMKFREKIQNAIVLPQSVFDNGIAGRVSLAFVICPGGYIHNIEVVSSKSEDCDLEAIRVIKAMGNWQPGEKDGEQVYSRVRYSVNFRKPKD